MSIKSFFARHKVGLVLRTHATKPEDAPKRARAVKEFFLKSHGIRVEDQPVFSQVDVMVWADERYPDADCGQTESALLTEFSTLNFSRVPNVHVFTKGDLFCGTLNYAVAKQLRAGVDYTLIASTEAMSYLNTETVLQMVDALDRGAVATGVAINELEQSVLDGRLANTMCLWNNQTLMSVGGFDLRAAKPVNDKTAHYLKGWTKEKGEVFYHLAGCEEVIPLARLVDVYGQCIAPILPTGEGAQRYQVPDPKTQSELYARHIAKMGTKLERQTALLASVGYDLSHLRGGVLEEYRHK